MSTEVQDLLEQIAKLSLGKGPETVILVENHRASEEDTAHRDIVLPQELIDLIIDYFANRPRDLTSLSLVCRKCHAYTLRYIFEFVSLRTEQTSAFLQFLKDAPRVSYYIRQLRFEDPEYQDPTNKLSLSTLRCVLAELPQLRELRLRGVTLCAFDTHSPDVFPNVVSLTIEHIHTAENSTFVLSDVFDMFPALRDVYLSAMDDRVIPSSSAHPTPYIRLHQLSIGPHASPHTLACARRLVASATVLRCGFINTPTAEFSIALRESLVRMEILVMKEIPWGLTYQPLPVSFPHLHTVLLRVRAFRGWFLHVLVSVPLTIKQLIFELEPDFSVLQDTEFTDVEFCINRLQHLTSVVIYNQPLLKYDFASNVHTVTDSVVQYSLVRKPVDEALKSAIKAGFPLLDTRGLLRWDSGPTMHQHCALARHGWVRNETCYHTRLDPPDF